LTPDGPFNSVILRAAIRPSDVESAVSASADEGLHVCVFGSEAQAAHTKRAMAGTANRTRRPFERGEVLPPTNCAGDAARPWAKRWRVTTRLALGATSLAYPQHRRLRRWSPWR
jgi:hypothetical protein